MIKGEPRGETRGGNLEQGKVMVHLCLSVVWFRRGMDIV